MYLYVYKYKKGDVVCMYLWIPLIFIVLYIIRVMYISNMPVIVVSKTL